MPSPRAVDGPPRQPERQSRRFERRLLGLFVLLLAGLALTMALSYRALITALDNEALVNHTYLVMAELDATLGAVTDAETGQRGFLFTSQDAYLEPYRAAVGQVGAHLAELQALTADDRLQNARAELLADKVRGKINELDRTLQAWSARGPGAARAIVTSNEGKARMDELRQLVGSMKAIEQVLLRARREESRRSRRQATTTLLVAGICMAALLALFYAQIQRGIAVRAQLLSAEHRNRVALEHAYAAERDARDQLEVASRLKDQFLATVSHELRTPLNAMLGWARMLRMGVNGALADRGLETIERNARAQAQLVEDILDISRIVTGKMKLDTRPVDLRTVIQSAVDVVGPAASAKRIVVHIDDDEAPCVVSGDPDRLQQVAWNLVSNAVKFTPAGGRVGVHCRCGDSHVRVTVTDSGQGIPADFLPYVFDPFRQADSSSTRAHAGLGLGLAIVRNIVELHGGTIHATSAGPGQGSTFELELPAAATRAEGPRIRPGVHREEPHFPSLRGLRVVAVDDEHDTLEMMAAVLATCGADVRTCCSAAEALDAVRIWRPDVLVADIAMPGEDGHTLIRKVRALEVNEGGTTPAIAVTALARAQDRQTALAAGFQVHVAKPVEPVELAGIVASVTGRTGH